MWKFSTLLLLILFSCSQKRNNTFFGDIKTVKTSIFKLEDSLGTLKKGELIKSILIESFNEDGKLLEVKEYSARSKKLRKNHVYTYNENNNLIEEVIYGYNNSIKRFKYIYDINADGDEILTIKNQYDGDGNLRVHYDYDNYNGLISKIEKLDKNNGKIIERKLYYWDLLYYNNERFIGYGQPLNSEKKIIEIEWPISKHKTDDSKYYFLDSIKTSNFRERTYSYSLIGFNLFNKNKEGQASLKIRNYFVDDYTYFKDSLPIFDSSSETNIYFNNYKLTDVNKSNKSIEISYDELGNETKYYENSTIGNIHYNYEYNFDTKGNWVEKYVYKDGNPYHLLVREISYY